jgi:hypothetical protein
MMRNSRLGMGMALGCAAIVSVAAVSIPTAEAAQVYYCQCKGEKARFLASTRYCERQTKVKRCSSSQFRKVYTRACIARGCELP